MMKNRQFLNYWVDALLLIGFLVAFFLDLTGLDGHQLLGAAVAVFSAYHLVLHWDWVKAVTVKLFGKLAAQAKIYYLLDAILLAGLGVISLTGLVISSWFGLELVNYVVWLDLHILISIATLLGLVVKVGLHWKWIIKTSQKIFRRKAKVGGVLSLPRLQPAPAAVDVSRREFVSLMSVVGVTAVVAASNGLSGLTSVEAEYEDSSQVNLVAQTSRSASSSSTTSSSSSSNSTTTITGCRIRCNKGCSYPGRCRKYVDANANKKCDLGECL